MRKMLDEIAVRMPHHADDAVDQAARNRSAAQRGGAARGRTGRAVERRAVRRRAAVAAAAVAVGRPVGPGWPGWPGWPDGGGGGGCRAVRSWRQHDPPHTPRAMTRAGHCTIAAPQAGSRTVFFFTRRPSSPETTAPAATPAPHQAHRPRDLLVLHRGVRGRRICGVDRHADQDQGATRSATGQEGGCSERDLAGTEPLGEQLWALRGAGGDGRRDEIWVDERSDADRDAAERESGHRVHGRDLSGSRPGRPPPAPRTRPGEDT